MKTLYEKIISIYPNLQSNDFRSIIMLQNDLDGRGDYIAKWEHPEYPEPTAEQLEEQA